MTAGLQKRLEHVEILSDMRDEPRPSDHVPVVAQFNDEIFGGRLA